MKAIQNKLHTMPVDLRRALSSAPAARVVWENITPLSRSEWICWVISGKKAETRKIRIEKALSKLHGGMPACRDARRCGAGLVAGPAVRIVKAKGDGGFACSRNIAPSHEDDLRMERGPHASILLP